MRKFIPWLKSHPTVSVVRMSGVIASGGRFGGGALNDAALAPLLEKAFRKGKPAAVALVINSPGGSPVQSSLIGAHSATGRGNRHKGICVLRRCCGVGWILARLCGG